MTKSPDLTLVVPCFNEAARIAETVRALTSWFPDHAEILVIDDGSSDETFEIVRELGSRNASVRAHRLPSNRGKGAAVRAAIPIVTGEKAVLMDADLAFDRASIELAVTALDEVDVVLGNRRHGQSRYSVPVRLFGFLYRRHLVGLAFNLFVRWLVGFGFRDTQCGLKGFRSCEAASP
jgi:glycosyltransferase involved in cell wall biosynthesis